MIKELPIFSYFDRQRFTQYGSMDCANWYGISAPDTKKQQALYPAMGRKHVSYFNQNKLIFQNEPRKIMRSINYAYAVVGTQVIRIDRFYNQQVIGNVSLSGNVWYDYLPVGLITYIMLTDETNVYVITETSTSITMETVTDNNTPDNPQFVAAFGNRFVVSSRSTPDYFLSTINLSGSAGDYFTINGAPLFNRASGVIGQFGVLHGQLYIFTDFNIDVWSNIPSIFEVAGAASEFPWKLNSSYNFDYGIADPNSLSVGFGRMAWLAKNRDGLVSFMATRGQQPEDISSQAVNVLLEQSNVQEGLSPFLENATEGFLYQYENTIFYRVSAGKFLDFGVLDVEDSANALEYNFSTGTWARVIELNGERNRIQQHIFFNNKHLVTVSGDPAIYEMAGNIYFNELRNTEQVNTQATDAFLKYPMRYELVTQQIFEQDYSEFITDYIQIDFVFGAQSFYDSRAPFDDTVFIVTESGEYVIDDESTNEDPVFIIDEASNTPSTNDEHYNNLYKPHLEIYYSDDGGVTFLTADVREFSPLGQYSWRMRWYELGPSRNRCYKLVCVSPGPIVILGGIQSVRRASGGAN